MNIENLRKGQLLRHLIKEYKSSIEFIKNNLSEKSSELIYQHCINTGTQNGICWYLRNRCDIIHLEILRLPWIYSNTSTGSSYWGETPTDMFVRFLYDRTPQDTQEVIVQSYINCLQLRVDIMEKELASGDKLHQRMFPQTKYQLL